MRLQEAQYAASKLRRRNPNMVRDSLITVSGHIGSPQCPQSIGISCVAPGESLAEFSEQTRTQATLPGTTCPEHAYLGDSWLEASEDEGFDDHVGAKGS